jgi:hypothetical protein
MSISPGYVKSWTRVGIVTGFLACVIYPLIISVPMPTTLQVLLAGAFGPLLSIACIGLYYFMSLHRKTVSLQIATISNIIAGTIVNMMLIVQLTVRKYLEMRMSNATDEQARELLRQIYSGVEKVQLGLDISWDIYISLGTILFALNMVRHPRFGRTIGIAGIIIGLLLLIANISTFPLPPAEADFIDFGPLAGIWYLVVTIMVLRSWKWLQRLVSESHINGFSKNHSDD